MVTLTCQKCECEYSVHNYRSEISKYCSRKCQTAIIGKLGGKASAGISRNKGNKRPDLAEYNRLNLKKGENHHKWKGNEVGYGALHSWMRREHGKPEKCQKCGRVKYVQWANKSGKYLRLKDDWIALCGKCHYKFDIAIHSRAVKNRWKRYYIQKEKSVMI